MFETFIILPLFNLLVLIYALLPGHNFGMAIIAFTIVVRILLWPMVKKQLHHTKEMRKLQPELKRIKKAAAGDRQKEAMMQMELYKEREISPFSSLGLIIVQLIVFIGLYQGLLRLINGGAQAIFDNAYSWVANIGWLQELSQDLDKFDATLFGLVDLTRAAIGTEGLYIPALVIVVGSVVVQFLQSQQLMPNDKDAKTLRQIMKEAKEGKQAEVSDTNAAVGRSMKYFLPGLIFFVTIGLPSALGLYWFVSGLIGYFQQAAVLKEDEEELGEIADAAAKKEAIEGEVIAKTNTSTKKAKKAKKASKSKKRRKKQ
jgi:YidC/Oxa1 family membrane protein insertase